MSECLHGITFIGRNGGHLAPCNFFGFKHRSETFGLDEARRAILIEEYTAKCLSGILRAEGLESAVDLVNGGRTNLFFSAREEQEARADFEAAKHAGVDVSGVQWLSKEDVEQVMANSGTY